MSVPYEEQLRKVLASTPNWEFISAMSCYNNPDDMVLYVRRRYQQLESMGRFAKQPIFTESTTRSGKVFRRQTKSS